MDRSTKKSEQRDNMFGELKTVAIPKYAMESGDSLPVDWYSFWQGILMLGSLLGAEIHETGGEGISECNMNVALGENVNMLDDQTLAEDGPVVPTEGMKFKDENAYLNSTNYDITNYMIYLCFLRLY